MEEKWEKTGLKYKEKNIIASNSLISLLSVISTYLFLVYFTLYLSLNNTG